MADDGQAKDNTNKEQQDSESRKKPQDIRRKRRIRFIVLAVLVIAAIAAIPIYFYYSVRESTDDAQVDGHIVPISPRINGTIAKVLVNDNQQVKKDQDLIWLDPADYQVAYDQAKAQYASAVATTTESRVNVPLTGITTSSSVRSQLTLAQQGEAGVSSAQQAVSAAEARLASAQASLAGKQATLVKAEKDLARMKDLVEKDEISRQEYDASIAERDADKADVDSAAADVIEAQHSLDQSKSQVVLAKAKLAQNLVDEHQAEQVAPKQIQVSEARREEALAAVKQRQADIEQAQLNLNYTIIKAPIEGRVSRKTAEPGMQISPGQQIMALVPLWDIWVTANFKETQLRRMHVGQDVEIEVDTYGGRKFRGHIDSIAAASGARFSLLPPENATGNYVKVVQRVPVKILLNNGEDREHLLLPGMSVTPTVLLNTGPGAR